MKARFYVSLILAVLLISYGCSGSSKIEMTEAQDALDHARNLHADNLAPTDFQKAQKAWDSGQAAEKEGKTGKAKVLFTSAKIFFDKAADIAKSRQDDLSRKLSEMQLRISKNFDRVRSDLTRNDLSPKQRSQVLAIVSEVEEDNDAISELVIQEDLLKAVATAKEVQTKIYHAQLILAGKKIK
jgi:hypothetical protein